MAALDCVSKVQLHISCEGLIDKDVLSKSDAICAVYIWDESYKRFRWREVSENVPNHMIWYLSQLSVVVLLVKWSGVDLIKAFAL